ncbi:hypothetical protein [Alicyclobacillus sp.]|uniref:hypothetical protein n=1 Tax=Alicyclobacillus sp. TaxID=61169 RepID=UPI0025BD51F2|nr:hypothetical protein [Alicyclobacillus sp.]MCL6515584.1 hypothetical protein [Alicyclobacillus sp.]
MKTSHWWTDLVVYLALLAVVWVLRQRLLRGLRGSGERGAGANERGAAARFARRWSLGAAAVATYLMAVGVLHEQGYLGAAPGGILYAAGIALVWWGLRSLRRFIQAQSEDREAPGQGPEVSDK